VPIALVESVELRALGSSDLSLTPIGLGTSAIGGGDWIFGWGPQHDAESMGTIRRALDEGVNWIDTAAAYGLGHAEVMVARALGELPRRERPYLLATCGLIWDELGNVSHSFRPDSIRRQAEASLRRLGVDCFDLYQLGSPTLPNSRPGAEAGSIEEAWETMTALQREGKARYIGVSGCDTDQLERLHRIAPVTSVQAPYSLMQRGIEDRMLGCCERRNRNRGHRAFDCRGRPPDGEDDPIDGECAAVQRLAPLESLVPGADDPPRPGSGRTAPSRWRPLRPDAGPDRDRVGAAQPGPERRGCRDPTSASGGRDHRGGLVLPLHEGD
jgi:diketogulonate reductase-like aldo/keto reductase